MLNKNFTKLFSFILPGTIDTEIRQKMTKSEGVWYCSDCDYNSKKSTNLYEHIEARHVAAAYCCVVCASHFKTKNTLRNHMYRQHRDAQH